MKSLKLQKGQSEAVNKRTNNTMMNEKVQTMMYKTLFEN